MRACFAPALAAGLAAFASGAAAQQPAGPSFAPPNLSPQGVRALAANCASCHGTNGRAAPGSIVASLAGRPAAELVEAMAQFRSGQRPATLMHQVAKGYSDAEVEAIAAWFAAQKR
jgi:cytochrome c553